MGVAVGKLIELQPVLEAGRDEMYSELERRMVRGEIFATSILMTGVDGSEVLIELDATDPAVRSLVLFAARQAGVASQRTLFQSTTSA